MIHEPIPDMAPICIIIEDKSNDFSREIRTPEQQQMMRNWYKNTLKNQVIFVSKWNAISN